MLPDKNELNDELIEQVGGGSSDLPELHGPASREAYGLPDILAVCLDMKIHTNAQMSILEIANQSLYQK